MKKQILLLGLLASGLAYSQVGRVGVNTDSPRATFEITPTTANAAATATTNEGILIPRVSRLRLNNIDTANLTESTMVYVNNISGSTSATTTEVNSTGYYYYDQKLGKWTKLATPNDQDLRLVGTDNHITQDAGIGGNGTSIGTARSSIAIGASSLGANTIGSNNIALGTSSLGANTMGSNNIAIGISSLGGNTTASRNIAIGNETLFNNTIGTNSIAVGYSALRNNTSGTGNIALGVSSLLNNTTGVNNIAIGSTTLANNKTGNNNIALGNNALWANETGNHNIAFGSNALMDNKADNNIAFGGLALRLNTTGANNIAIGKNSMYSNTTGANNIALGNNSLNKNTEGANNIALGNSSLFSNTTGGSNLAIGLSVLRLNTTGNNNIGLGSSSLFSNTTGVNNVGIGPNTLRANTIGTSNIAIGINSLNSNTQGNRNVALGDGALQGNTHGNYNVAIGAGNLKANTTGQSNVSIGVNSLTLNTTGVSNIALGGYALASNTTGNYNIGIGLNSLNKNTTATHNTALGYLALENTTTGNYNVGVGPMALRNNTTGTHNNAQGLNAMLNNTTGNRNIALGYESGAWIKGNANVHIGSAYIQNTDVPTELDNVIVIGNGINAAELTTATAQDNTILLGVKPANGAHSPNVGVGVYKPAEKLHVAGNVAIGYDDGVATYPKAGNYLSFEGTGTRSNNAIRHTFPNTDVLAFYRYDIEYDHSHLRLVLGDNEMSDDAFSIGVRNHTASNNGYARGHVAKIDNVFTEKFRFTAQGYAMKDGGGAWSVLSDARLKENVKPYQRGLKEVLQINPVNFTYKKNLNKGNAVQTGVIAQEIEKVVPSMVGTTKETINGKQENVKFVDNNEYTFMLINAIKEQQKQIEELKAKVEALEKQKK